jgi:hypothetical protein
MEVIEHFEEVCAEPSNILEKMRRIDIIETATRELRMSLGLNTKTERELNGIGISPKEFIRRFQATEVTGQ